MTPERRIEILERTIHRNEKFWMRAAESALAGDDRELRLRVEMIKAGPMDIVLSDESTREPSK